MAEALGVSLCAKQVVSGYDRARLVRLCATVPSFQGFFRAVGTRANCRHETQD